MEKVCRCISSLSLVFFFFFVVFVSLLRGKSSQKSDTIAFFALFFFFFFFCFLFYSLSRAGKVFPYSFTTKSFCDLYSYHLWGFFPFSLPFSLPFFHIKKFFTYMTPPTRGVCRGVYIYPSVVFVYKKLLPVAGKGGGGKGVGGRMAELGGGGGCFCC